MSVDAGIDGKDAALDIPDLRSLLDFICFLRRTAVQTALHLITTGIMIRFIMRGRAAVATLGPDDLVAPRQGDVLELTRGQETELPKALKWQVARADEDYDAALVEARRITVDTTRIASESFPMVPYLDTLRWVFIAVALGGIAVTIYARLDDWKRGRR
jgi:hypothetical protein